VVVTGHIRIDAVIEGKPKLLNSRYTDVWRKGRRSRRNPPELDAVMGPTASER
jgi:hypothetical protein